MDDKDKIIDRVRKLLELAASENVNEAANAAASAQGLMSKHAISEAMLDVGSADDEEIEDALLHGVAGTSLAKWKGRLAVAICNVNQCQCYRISGDIGVVGRPSDAQTVRYLFTYVAREIDRITKQEAGFRGNPGKTWTNNFRMGAVDEISNRLYLADKDARASMKREADATDTLGNGVALVRINDALTKIDDQRKAVKDYGKRVLNLRKRSSSETRYDREARSAGKRAGASIDLDTDGGDKLGAGSRRRLDG